MTKPSRLAILIITIETALLAAVYLSRSVLTAGDFGFPLDDPWIHAVLARNLVEGHGLSYNPGQPVGSTSILYTLLLAGTYRIIVAPVTNAVVLGLLMHVASSWLIYCLAMRLTGRQWAAIASAAVFAAVPRLMWGALAGMEVPLYVLLVTLGVFLHIRYTWHNGPRAYLSTAAFALATLARPECGTFMPVAFLDRMITAHRFDRPKGGLLRYLCRLPLHAVLAAAIIAPAVWFNLWATGRPLPLPFYVKTQAALVTGPGRSVLDGVLLLPQYVTQIAQACIRDNPVAALACLVGIALCIRWSRRSEHDGIAILPLSLFLVPIASALAARITPSLPHLLFQYGRYSAYLVPIMVTMAAVGAVGIQTAVRAPRPRKWLAGLAAAGAAAGLIASNIAVSDQYAWGVENINDMHVRIGRWAARLPSDAVLAVNDAGAIAYFSRRQTLDLVGIVNSEVIPYHRRYPLPASLPSST